MTQKNKRAVIYARVSTDEQETDRQIRDLKAFAKRAGYKVIETFSEKMSGAKDNRKQRSLVLELARQRKIDCILITEMSRWGRNTADLLNTLQELNSYNVSLITQTGMTFDLDNAQGKMMAGMLALVAEFERSLLRERTISGLNAARARGKKLGRQVGQNPSDKYAAKVLKWLDAGKTIRWIADELHISTTTVQAIKRRSKEK